MSILSHTWGVLIKPESEWKSIRDDETSFMRVYVSISPILALIPALSAYFGVTLVGWTVGDGGNDKAIFR